MKRATLMLAAVALLLGGVGQARAGFITYELTATASGTIDGKTETNAPLIEKVTYDTSKVTSENLNFGYLQTVDNQSVVVTFGGITDTVTTASQTYYQSDVEVGFLAVSLPGATFGQSLLGLASTNFVNESLTNPPSGPLSGGSLAQGQTYNTIGGSISITSAGTVTFTSPAASATPEPSTLTLLGLGSLGLLSYGWRRRNRAAA